MIAAGLWVVLIGLLSVCVRIAFTKEKLLDDDFWKIGAESTLDGGGVPETALQETVVTVEGLEHSENAAEEELPQGENAAAEELPFFEEPDADHYAYDSLSDAERLWYLDINDALGNMLPKQELNKEGFDAGLDETDIDKVFQCVLNDHPEYFYVEGYTYTKYTRLGHLVKLDFSGSFSMDVDEARSRREQIHLAVEQLLSQAPKDGADYEKIRYVYETLIRNTEYDLDSTDNQNIYSVFINRVSVCQGYAKATQYLLNRMGIACTMVIGSVDTGEGHAWNLVKADGDYYYLDTTWGDASYRTNGESAFVMPEINYDYLCVTTDQLFQTHVVGGVVPMPVCDSIEDNYYVREGVYFTDFEEERLAQVFQKALEEGRRDVTLKCSDRMVYENMAEKLIREQEIFHYFEAAGGRIAYAQNEKQLSLTFWMTNE